MTRYENELRWLYSLESRGARLGLDRIRTGLRVRDNPQKALCCVHIAGTNGKGSVAAMLESVFRHAGYLTGQFCSPHLHRYVERVQVGGRPITEAFAATKLAEYRNDKRLASLTFFELTTLLGFETFQERACDVVFIETGLGGRLDSTNVIKPEVSVITNIGLEHTRVLGRSYAAIAKEKAGILKRGVPAVIGVRHLSARDSIEQVVKSVRARALWIGDDFDAVWGKTNLDVRVGSKLYHGVRLGLAGQHQKDNAACVAATAELLTNKGFRLNEVDLRSGLAKAHWPGRLEHHSGKPSFLFDAAHNAAGCASLAAYLMEHMPRGRVVLLFGAMVDKNHKAMLGSFNGLVDRFVYAVPKMRRAADPRSFARIKKGVVTKSVRDGVARARKLAGPQGLVVVAGSIFVVSEARAIVKKVRQDPLIGL